MARKIRTQKKSWERRRRKRIKRIILILMLAIVGIAAGILINATFPYEEADLCDLFTIEYDGYNTNGTARAVLNDEHADQLLSLVREDYENSKLHLQKVEPEDYVSFRSSLNAFISPNTNLSNGSNITITVAYDKKLAEKLKIDVTSVTRNVTVNGLVQVTKISYDQLFADVEVNYSGISPSLEASVVNNSTHPFLKDVAYEIVEPKEFYTEGDSIEVCAIFDSAAALDMHFLVDESEGLSKVFNAHSDTKYVDTYQDISNGIIQEACSRGMDAFTNANEFGVRIFCEGNLVPVYINKQATFVWGTPRAISAYFKTVLPGYAGTLGYNYNDLDVLYEVSLSQADGKACTAYCVVRFSNFIKNADGSISYDFTNPKIVSASYYSKRVKENVVDAYIGEYEVNKVL